MTRKIMSINEIISDYDVFIFDQWGVLHNGGDIFPQAKIVLNKLHSQGKEICIASNSGNRSLDTSKKLLTQGIDFIKNENIITSGEEFHLLFNNSYVELEHYHDYQTLFSQRKVFLISNDDNQEIFKTSTDFQFTNDITEMGIIVIKGVKKDSDNIQKYYNILEQGLKMNLPLICINSDLVSKGVDGTLHICPGTLAKFYQEHKGKVFWHGKPYHNIFNLIKNRVGKNQKFLMIGDNFDTDIQGGCDNFIDTLFIHDTGIHEQENFSDLLKKYKISPTFYLHRLQ